MTFYNQQLAIKSRSVQPIAISEAASDTALPGYPFFAPYVNSLARLGYGII